MKRILYILVFCFVPSILFAQAAGGTIKRSNKKREMTTTRKIFTISENYAGRKYNYNIRVENGKIYWSYSGEGGKESKSLNCNPDVNADIIIEEFKGLVYWGMATDLLFYMVEDEKIFVHDIYVGAKDAFGKCVSSLSKAKGNCPNAFKKAQGMYKDLINAENSGAKPLWDELSLLSYGMGEYPLSVCDIY
jgi:hypothetical protein